jgi:hypothetical protein
MAALDVGPGGNVATPTRNEALATLEEGQTALDKLLARLSDDELTRPATIGGGAWSAKDLLGHIAFWEELALQSLDAFRAGRSADAEGIFSGGATGVDAANARNQERTATQSLAEVRARAKATHAAILSAIRAATDAEWQASVPTAGTRRQKVVTLVGGVLGAPKRPFGHAFAHLADLQTYVDSIHPAT